MTEYMPKVGDKVRATLGESLNVGDVVEVGPSWVDVHPVDAAKRERPVTVWRDQGWQFEQVVTVPSKFGAVIRRADGRHFSLGNDGAWFAPGDYTAYKSKAVITEGGFSVLFDGVDE